MYEFNVICSYSTIPQDIFDIEVSALSEALVLGCVFEEIRENLHQLEKISLCLRLKNGVEPPEWLLEKNGKYFFSTK
jgi:hypothetical protein